MTSDDDKIEEKWQVIKQKVRGGPRRKVTVCFACGEFRDCKAILLCDECAKELIKRTEVKFNERTKRV